MEDQTSWIYNVFTEREGEKIVLLGIDRSEWKFKSNIQVFQRNHLTFLMAFVEESVNPITF